MKHLLLLASILLSFTQKKEPTPINLKQSKKNEFDSVLNKFRTKLKGKTELEFSDILEVIDNSW